MGDLLISVPAAVAAAACFGLTGALQHRAARRTGEQGTIRIGLVGELLRQPVWLGSLVANGLGIALQWLALATGPLILVQPLLVTGLVFAVLFSAALGKQRPDRVVLLGAGLCVAGLAGFLLIASPQAGQDRMSADEVWPLAGGLCVLLVLCLAVAFHRPGRTRALALATATGLLYGVTAGLAKLATDDLRRGLWAALTNWPLYLVVVCGLVGFVLNQNAFRVGVALAPALAVIVVLDPLVGIGIGALWLGEQLRTGPWPIIGQVLALAVLVVGVAVLSVRAPHAAREQR